MLKPYHTEYFTPPPFQTVSESLEKTPDAELDTPPPSPESTAEEGMYTPPMQTIFCFSHSKPSSQNQHRSRTQPFSNQLNSNDPLILKYTDPIIYFHFFSRSCPECQSWRPQIYSLLFFSRRSRWSSRRRRLPCSTRRCLCPTDWRYASAKQISDPTV